MTDPWTDLLAMADAEQPLVGADRVATWPAAALPELERLGLLCETTPATVRACPDCPDEPLRDILWIEDHTMGIRRAYQSCARCGPCEVDRHSLRRWLICWPALVDVVHKGFELRGSVRELVPGRLWRLGLAHWSGRPTTVHAGRALQRRDATNLLSLVDQSTTALLCVARRLPTAALRTPVVPLELCSAWNGRSIGCDPSFAAVQVRPMPAASKASFPRPRKRAHRTAVIERLRRELHAHLRAARDHLQAAWDHEQEPSELPCPTRGELARRCATSEPTVSRCFQEVPDLRALWQAAQDPFRLAEAMLDRM